MKYSKTILKSYLSGALLAFAYPHFAGNGLFILAPVSLGFFYYLLTTGVNLRSKILTTFFYSLGFSSIGFYWIPQTLSTFGGIPLSLGYVVSIFFSIIVLPHLWPLAFIQHLLKLKKVSHKLQVIILCITHVLLEQMIAGQFPVWIGHSLLTTNTKLVLTSYFGVGIYSFSLIILAVNFSSYLAKTKIYIKQIIIALFILILDFSLHFAIQVPSALSDPSEQALHIRFAQANIGNFLKIESEKGKSNSVEEVYTRYKNLSLKNLPTNSPIDLLIWPETAIPTVFNSDHLEEFGFRGHQYISELLLQIPIETSLLFGGYDEGKISLSTNSEQSQYNSSFFVSDSGTKIQVYHKIKLIPFGETLPFGSWNTKLYPLFPGVSLFSQGHQLNNFQVKNKYRFITPICYEILDTHFMRKFAESTSPNIDFMVNLTNDSWYGDTAEPWQHLYLARWRSIELRKPILRSTNTGITTIIDERGNFEEYLDIGAEDILDIKLNLHARDKTLYQRLGILPLLLLLFLFIILTSKNEIIKLIQKYSFKKSF